MAANFLIYSAVLRLTDLVKLVSRDGQEIYDIEEVGDGNIKVYVQPIGGPQRWRGCVIEKLESEGESHD